MQRVEGPVYFSVAAGTGVDALVMAATSPERKRRWGMGAYVATTVRVIPQIRSRPHLITVDGVSFEAPAAMVLVANCGDIVPGMVRLGHGFAPDDGWLDVVVIRADGLWDAVRVVWHVLRDLPAAGRGGTFLGYARGRVITVETDTPQPVEMDGDPNGETPFTAEVVPGAVTVVTGHT